MLQLGNNFFHRQTIVKLSEFIKTAATGRIEESFGLFGLFSHLLVEGLFTSGLFESCCSTTALGHGVHER